MPGAVLNVEPTLFNLCFQKVPQPLQKVDVKKGVLQLQKRVPQG